MTGSETLITILYALVGATGALSIVIFIWGFIEYLTKIGLPDKMRDPGINIMEWGVRFILTSVFLIAALKLFERWFG